MHSSAEHLFYVLGRHLSRYIMNVRCNISATRLQACDISLPDWNASVEVYKNRILSASIPINTPLANLTIIDTAPITGPSYGVQNYVQINGKYYINIYSDNLIDPTTLNTGGADFYLIRIVGANSRTAYAGPIWIEVAH